LRPNTASALAVTPLSGLHTTEGGGTATFTVTLSAEPAADVAITIASSKPGEGTVSPVSIELTHANWGIPVTVTVTGIDDVVDDGDADYTIHVDGGESGAVDVAVTNNDNDGVGVSATPTSGLMTTESGGTASFTVALTSQPLANVTIPINSADTKEGTVAPATLTFTAANWNAPQTVTVTGVNDDLADGARHYAVTVGPAASTDPAYAGLDADDVAVTNIDNDSPGVIVTPTSGLVTSEAGATASFTVVLASQPTAGVAIAMSSNDPGEGTAAPASLTFTPANWNAPQIVTATGANDDEADGVQSYTIVLAAADSTDPGYAGVDPADVAVSNTDNDTAGSTVTPTSGLQTTESGGTAIFTVVLNSQPTADVAIALTSSKLTEGIAAPASLVFTTTNWSAPQIVTVTGLDDARVDGNQPYDIVLAPAVSPDPNYDNTDPADIAVTNLDNDTAGFLVTPTSGLQTTESGGTATFTVVLLSQPAANVTIPLTSSDLTEAAIAPASITFTNLNWDAPQTVTVTGADDAFADGNQSYTILSGPAVSTDPGYAGITMANVAVTNLDNDTAGILISPTSGLVTTESGGTASFNLVLTSQPVSDVAISVGSSKPGEASTSISTLVFTPANYNAPQTVTVTGLDDAVADGNQIYTVMLGQAVTTDPDYALIDPPDVAATNLDNDAAGIQVTPTSGLATNEAGANDVFTVVLLSQPTANVTITISPGDPTEGTVLPATLTFTPADFNLPKSVTVTGADDATADGNQTYQVILAPAVSTDPSYAGIDPSDVTVVNVDNDAPGILVDPTDIQVSEFGDTDTFDLVLASQPTANVTITLTSTDLTEGTVSPASVTFTPATFNVPQTVTVTGVNDAIADGNQVFTILTGAATSADPGYAGLDPADVTAINIDNETPNVFVKARRRLFTTEGGGTATFRVKLTTQPTASVTCTVASSDLTEGQVSPPSLVFTATNYSQFKTVTILGLDDAVRDGDQLYTILTAACTSTDPSYDGRNPNDVSVINRDND
jgi:large repetitive protein